jgi:hypothetical protein
VRKYLFFLAALMLFTLIGCDDSDDSPAPKAEVVKKETAKSVPSTVQPAVKVVGRASGKLRVSILPVPATVDGCLKALVSSSGQSEYHWEINGSEVEGQTSNRLCKGFWRDDEVTITARNGNSTGTFSVIIANSPPRITEVSINSDGIPKHTDLVVEPEIFDADDDSVAISYQWYINDEAETLLTENALPAKSYLRGDTIRFTIAITDGYADGKLYESASLVVPNAAPQFLSQPPEEFAALEYNYQVEALDPDGDKLAYLLEEAPDGMTINRANGLIRWPLVDVTRGEYKVRIVVKDSSDAEAVQEYTMTLGEPH